MTRTIALMCTAAALLVACASPTPAPKTPVPIPAIDRPGARAVTVTDVNTGAAVTLESAQELIVRLPVAPTNGLEWSVVDLGPGVLTLASRRFERETGSAILSVADGTSVFHFRPQAAGQRTLTFELRRPHSLLPAVQTVVYQVTVR